MRLAHFAWVVWVISSSVGLASAAAKAPRVLFGPNWAAELGALQSTGVSVAGRTNRLEIAGGKGVGEQSLVLPLALDSRDLSAWRQIEAEVWNAGDKPVTFTFWAMSGQGWGGVSTFSYTQDPTGRETLAPGRSAVIRIDLHAAYPGREVPAIDPRSVHWLEFVFEPSADPLAFLVGEIRAIGAGLTVPSVVSDRIRVAESEAGLPAPGKRVFRALPDWQATEVRHVLTLPAAWVPGRAYPVLVEYPGSRFFHKWCYSTGRARNAHYGHGLAQGGDYIVLNLPFISPDGKREQVSGWGDIDHAVAYCLAAVEDAAANFGGDRGAVVFTGFSRGSYAANYLALRNDTIAALWRGFITPSHPGKPWVGPDKGWANVGEGWDERAARLGAPWFFASARFGRGVHVDGDFLEDSPSTRTTREWLADLVGRAR
jgi:hypothetical protein